MPSAITLQKQQLQINGSVLLEGVGEQVSLLDAPIGAGVFVKFTAPEPKARHVFSLGTVAGVARFTCCHRYEPFWMKPAAGTRAGEVPVETQFLLLERSAGSLVALVPLIDRALRGAFRASLQGAGEQGLELIAESGDPAIAAAEMVGLYIAEGSEVTVLMAEAALAVRTFLGTGRLTHEKPHAEFTDTFGWCTWDAFYQEVSHDKIREGLDSFKAGGITPKTLILDDGWQSVAKQPSGETRLTSFSANAKFPGDLAPTVRMAKEEYGVETFLVWHAMNGYWGGIDGEALPGYGISARARNFSPGILHHRPTINGWWGGVVGTAPPEHIYRFFNDYHRHLREQGVDGVKVDSQATLEGVAAGFGGRVELMRRYREALEGSVQVHFAGNLINCMSCANEMLYSTLASSLTRTSTDFWPDRPESHGEHLYTNAQVSLWFGEFIQPDWDMFQSGHPMGAYHAAGRAVSGAPVYVSDKPGRHDFNVLRKLVKPDGTVFRAQNHGQPTRDCLFHDPTKENVLLKIFNYIGYGGVLGAFNAQYAAEGEASSPISGVVRPADVWGLPGLEFAVYAHHAGELRSMDRDETWKITLAQLTYEIFNIVPIQRGFAPIGLVDMFNSAGAVEDWEFEDSVHTIVVTGAGRFVAWCESRPILFSAEGRELDFEFDDDTGRLECILEEPVSTLLIALPNDA